MNILLDLFIFKRSEDGSGKTCIICFLLRRIVKFLVYLDIIIISCYNMYLFIFKKMACLKHVVCQKIIVEVGIPYIVYLL